MGRRTISCSLALMLAGCSFTFGQGPPAQHEQMPYFDCVSTYGLPVADGFFAIGNVSTGVEALTHSKQEYADMHNGAKRDLVAGANLALAAVFGASAVYGIVQASRCTRAKAALKARIEAPLLRSAPPPRSGGG
jgi:hypothetical protein